MDLIRKARLFAPHSEDGELLADLADQLEAARNGTPVTSREQWENLPVGSLALIRYQPEDTSPVQVHRIPFNELVGAHGHYLAGGTQWSAVWDTTADAVLLYRPHAQEQDQVPAIRRNAA